MFNIKRIQIKIQDHTERGKGLYHLMTDIPDITFHYF